MKQIVWNKDKYFFSRWVQLPCRTLSCEREGKVEEVRLKLKLVVGWLPRCEAWEVREKGIDELYIKAEKLKMREWICSVSLAAFFLFPTCLWSNANPPIKKSGKETIWARERERKSEKGNQWSKIKPGATLPSPNSRVESGVEICWETSAVRQGDEIFLRFFSLLPFHTSLGKHREATDEIVDKGNKWRDMLGCGEVSENIEGIRRSRLCSRIKSRASLLLSVFFNSHFLWISRQLPMQKPGTCFLCLKISIWEESKHEERQTDGNFVDGRLALMSQFFPREWLILWSPCRDGQRRAERGVRELSAWPLAWNLRLNASHLKIAKRLARLETPPAERFKGSNSWFLPTFQWISPISTPILRHFLEKRAFSPNFFRSLRPPPEHQNWRLCAPPQVFLNRAPQRLASEARRKAERGAEALFVHL